MQAKAAVEQLQATTAAQLWLKDLEEFEAAFVKQAEVRTAALASSPRKVMKKVVKQK
jgi:hypothetical protein